MRTLLTCGLIALLLSLGATMPVAAQTAPSTAPAAPAATGPKNAEFQTQFEAWKGTISKLRQLQVEYRTADAARRTAIQGEFKPLAEQALAQQSQLIEAAKAAYAEAPNANPDVVELLVSMLGGMVQADACDEALTLAEMLIAQKCPEKALSNLAGVAAFGADQFDKAEQYLTQAKTEGVLDETGQQDLQFVATEKAAWAKEQEIRAAEAKADNLPRVKMKTSKGDLVIELYEDQAPNTVANFIALVEKGFYNGLTFHRVLPGFMAQGGCPDGTGAGGPGYTIKCECVRPDYRKHFRGTLSMAHAGRDTGGSQFFLTFLATPFLDGKHTVFGRVIEGLDVLPKIQRRDPDDPRGPAPDTILEATVIRKRDHAYTPETGPER